MANILNPNDLIQAGGILLVGSIIFAESGLLIGFFLPGDTLLLSAGFFAGTGRLHLLTLLIVTIAAAILGDNLGYTIGKRTGHRIFKKDTGKLFHKDHLQRAEKFYEKHGGKTIILARFIPVVRTFAPMAAGMAKMPHKRFFAYNIVGGTLWGGGVTMLGYGLAKLVGEYINLEKYLLIAVAVAIIATFGGTVGHLLKDKQTRQELFAKFIGRNSQ
ncbi:DedA family protein [Candidatus Saccharibacteria bacterium]|nr:DedA family protein [Candidatus Saccharibacteria bacterium]